VYEEEMWPLVSAQLAEDAYKGCCGRLYISITVVRSWGRLENLVVSEFLSNEDLFEACLASSTIPYITERGGYRLFRGMKVIDGGLTNNTPVFRDGIRRQLVFRLSQVT
jgi:predicted acylesterase/phospholipase RssA